ncbi:hypothetical protein Tco_0821587 [Tanacetum coccineum]|uniref:Integrase, catalytic region, zinc finger, CCHC-type, peptidase aspartic, catalytic n=1 Tax=Tanacetum coccineum TaxID=301880 RepID=A0ABQ5AGT4_9ASTR
MANLLEDIQCAGSDTRPPMLDRTDFASWQQRTFWETLSEGNEGALHLGPERPRVYSNLSLADKERYNTDIRETNILLQGLPIDIYTLINHYTNAKDIWDNVKTLLEGTAGYEGAQNRVRNANPCQARQIKCYNGNAHENGMALDEEQLLFLVGRQDNAVDEDVDEQPVQDLALNMDNVFQAYDYPVCDEASPSYDSDILSEVHDHDQYQDAVCEHHEAHEMHDDYVKDNAVPDVQSNLSYVPNDAFMMILNDIYKQPAHYASVTTQHNVVDNSLTAELATYKEQVELYKRRARFELTEREQKIDEQLRIKENKYLEEFLDMKALKEKVEDKLFKQDQSLQTVHMLCKPKPYYDELRKVAIGYMNPLCLTRAKQVQPALYNGHEIVKTNHVSAIVHNSDETLEIAKITRKKMNEK